MFFIFFSGECASDEQGIDDDWEKLDAEDYHTLILPASRVKFVSTESDLLAVVEMLLNELLHSACVVDPTNNPSRDESSFRANNDSFKPCDLDDVETAVVNDNPSNLNSGKDEYFKRESDVADTVENTLKTVKDVPESTLNNNKVQPSSREKAATTESRLQSANRSLLVSGGASIISGAASLVSGGVSIVSGGVSLVSGTASLVCSGASAVSGGASLVSSGVSLVTGRSSLISAGASLVSGGASLMSGGSTLVSSGVSLVSGTASVVSGGISLVSGGASLVSGAASIVAGGVARVATGSPRKEGFDRSTATNTFPVPSESLRGPNGALLLALDCEWKPSVNRGKSELSLLQLATPTDVFVLDMIALVSYRRHWDQIVSNLFNNQEVLKIGKPVFFVDILNFHFRMGGYNYSYEFNGEFRYIIGSWTRDHGFSR